MFFWNRSFWGVYLALEALDIDFNDLSEWGRFATMLTFLKKQLLAFLLQHMGAGKTSLTANHAFEMCRTAMQYTFSQLEV